MAVGGMFFKHISKGRYCPLCKSAEVFRVRRSGMALKFVCNVTNLRPHRCSHCDTFFLAPRHGKVEHVVNEFGITDRKAGETRHSEHGDRAD
jgi:hypothetical protein